MYEMLVGYPPFYSDDPMLTCRKVIFLKEMFFVINAYLTFTCVKRALLESAEWIINSSLIFKMCSLIFIFL